jgi:hypothetical protein
LGSGGGSGGSIQFITKNIQGTNAQVILNGGRGSLGGGGGGSGGRFANYFLQSFNASNALRQSLHWDGWLDLSGGEGGALFERTSHNQHHNNNWLLQATNSGGRGQDGTSHQSKCFGGYYGPFCHPCEVGTYKYHFGYGVCEPCTNKPKNAFYTSIAQSSSQCEYECVEGFEPYSVNPNCLSSVDLQVERVGGPRGTLVTVSMLSLLSLFMWIVILIRSRYNKTFTNNEYETVFRNVLFSEDSDDNT